MGECWGWKKWGEGIEKMFKRKNLKRIGEGIRRCRKLKKLERENETRD
jgi:hypothetical protein